jgi:riboflavin kinase/FMN adenylyltransferase
MRVLSSPCQKITKDAVCGIGSFDGVHRGHQAIVHRLKELSGRKTRTGVITFVPLPFFVIHSAPVLTLTLKREKEQLFRELGVDFMYYFKFTPAFASIPPEDFITLIARRIAPRVIVVGENFHFGRRRSGSAQMLKELTRTVFDVEILPRIVDDGTISSTRIRELLLLGHAEAAHALLGRPYAISGTVIRGKGKGTILGFPTINLKVNKEKLMPLDGVYKVHICIRGRPYLGAMFCRQELLEVHILGFSGNLYRKRVTVDVLKRIRAIERFESDEALRRAIAHDVEAVGKE